MWNTLEKRDFSDKLAFNLFSETQTSKMTSSIIESMSTRKLTYVVVVLMSMQLACFLIGALVSPTPNSSMQYLATNCIDPSGGQVTNSRQNYGLKFLTQINKTQEIISWNVNHRLLCQCFINDNSKLDDESIFGNFYGTYL